MKYIDAGYAVALGTLALYSLGLLARRRRLERGVRGPGAPVEAAGPPSSP